MRPEKEERVKYHTDYEPYTEFAAHARLLQSKWREGKGYEWEKYGNFLKSDFATSSKANFLTPKIQDLVEQEIKNIRAAKGLIKEPRIWDNLLSSQPLCFNLFGELHYDLQLASQFFRVLFPDRVGEVTAVKFEYSPGRRDVKYTGDNSAFDVFVEYSKDGRKGFIGIEVKYSESLREESAKKAEANYKVEYDRLAAAPGLFKADKLDVLKKPPIAQIWRDHLLSISMKQDYNEGFFVFLYPSGNIQCENGVKAYQECLVSDDEAKSGFYPRHLEDFISELSRVVQVDWVDELRIRYLGVE